MKNYKIYIKLFFLIPIIIILLIIRIFKDFRISRIEGKKIGHMTIPIEIHICEKKDDPNKAPVLWFLDDNLSTNQFLKKQWSQKLNILPRYLLEPIYILFKKYRFFHFFFENYNDSIRTNYIKSNIINSDNYIAATCKCFICSGSRMIPRYIKDGVKQIDDNNLMSKYKPSIEFNQNEKNEGENYLKKIGVQNKKFFTFASRSSEFHNENMPEIRNTNIDDKISGIKFMVSKGYKAIRMGKFLKEKINFSDSNIIDHATSSKANDFLDIYLISKCEFMISDSTGITGVAALFRKPCLLLNDVGMHSMVEHPNRVMYIMKKFLNRNTGELVRFEEVYKNGFQYESFGLQALNRLGYDIIDNSELEIKKATESFYDLMNKNLDLDEILNKQKKYWQLIEKLFGIKNTNKVIICPNFYLNNINLYE